MRRASKRDANANAIIKAAEQAGVMVIVIEQPVDLLCGIAGRWYLVEVKVPKGTYTPGQIDLIAQCAHEGLPLLTWRSVDDALAGINAIRSRTYLEVLHVGTPKP